jgi:hypothetical protein
MSKNEKLKIKSIKKTLKNFRLVNNKKNNLFLKNTA